MKLCRTLARNLVAGDQFLVSDSRWEIKGIVTAQKIHVITTQDDHFMFKENDEVFVVLPNKLDDRVKAEKALGLYLFETDLASDKVYRRVANRVCIEENVLFTFTNNTWTVMHKDTLVVTL